ncbi:MAG: bacteriohemerythrin [Magnetococcus sp. DMHC-8]
MTSLNEWNPSWNTGVSRIDEEHVRLFGIWQAFQDAYVEFGAVVVSGILEELVDYTRYHFANEEQQLAQMEYVRLPEHREAHRQLTETLLAFCDTLNQTQDRESMLVEVGSFFQNWFVQHIQEMDFAAFQD